MAGKTRSPNYPALSLKQAVEAAKSLWDEEKRTPVDDETAVLAMGYKSLSGPARVAIGALRQYGLIDKADKGQIRLSDLAIQILLADSPDERAAAMTSAATNPPLFSDLSQTHAEASENAIRSYLLTKKGFADDGARKAARAFRETLALAQVDGSGYSGAGDSNEGEVMAELNIDKGGGQSGGGKPSDGVFALNVPFAKGSIAVQVRVTGDAIRPAHLARVRKYLELAEQDWNEGAE
jgi:hypothetical protein